MFKLEITDNDQAQFTVALLHDGAEYWRIRLEKLIKDGQEHTNLAEQARRALNRARATHLVVLEDFTTQMDQEADAALSTGGLAT